MRPVWREDGAEYEPTAGEYAGDDKRDHGDRIVGADLEEQVRRALAWGDHVELFILRRFSTEVVHLGLREV